MRIDFTLIAVLLFAVGMVLEYRRLRGGDSIE